MKYPDAPVANIKRVYNGGEWWEGRFQHDKPYPPFLRADTGGDQEIVLRKMGYRPLEIDAFRFDRLWAHGWLRWAVNTVGQAVHRRYWCALGRLYRWRVIGVKKGTRISERQSWAQVRPFPFGHRMETK